MNILGGRISILVGDVRDRLRELSDDHFDCVVTSPPYWGLRDYGVSGQIGLESSLGEHINVMVDVFREVRRVLKPTGTLWLNYGDCYATSPNGRSAAETKALGDDDRTFRDKPFSTIGGVLKPKDLCMLPNRIAIALQESGWWVRSEIIWHKPNPMPESTRDRPTTSHEKIWLLTKSQRYFYDADAIAERSSNNSHGGKPIEGGPKQAVLGQQIGGRMGLVPPHGVRNARNVWSIGTAAFSEAHFATFPPEIPERCIKAGCPVSGEVLDPFGGSGTTAMVAASLGRRATIIELNPDYAQLAKARIEAEFMGKDEGRRHMHKSLGKAIDLGPLFAMGDDIA
jgi:DNA modification methylase